MKRIAALLIALLILLVAYAVYRARADGLKNVDPAAAREIEKAQRR